MVMLDAPSAGPQPTARSPARDRRLRQLRQNARVRLRLVADVAMLAAHHSSHPPVLVDAPVARAGPGWRHEAAALREQITDLRALVVSLMAAHHHGPAGPAAPAVVARLHDAGGGLDARVALAPASDAATEDAVTAGQASVPVVAVGAKANEDGVMDPVVVAAEKTATEAATFSEMDVEELVEEVDGVRGCRSSAGTASADGAVDVDDCHALEVSEPLSVSSPLSTPVVCHFCRGSGRTLFGPCVTCARRGRAALDDGRRRSHMVSSAGSVDRQSAHRTLSRDRYIIGDDAHFGEVLHVAVSCVWVRPLGPLPSEVETELSEASEDGRRLYVAMADIAEDGLVLDVGAKVVFKFYKNHTGVGGCEVTSACGADSKLCEGCGSCHGRSACCHLAYTCSESCYFSP